MIDQALRSTAMEIKARSDSYTSCDCIDCTDRRALLSYISHLEAVLPFNVGATTSSTTSES